MRDEDASADIKELSIVARQCIAAACLDRYCHFHGLNVPEIDALIDHIWKITNIRSPDDFVAWERGFGDLAITGLGDPIPPSVLAAIPAALHSEFDQLVQDTVETSATTWYGSDPDDDSLAYLLNVVRTLNSYGIPLPDIRKFRSSDPTKHGGWGTNPTADQAQVWRYGQHNMEEIKARIVDAFASDPFLCQFWSGKPECDVLPEQNGDYFKHVLATVFVRESVLNGVNVGAIIKRMAELVRPHIESVDELCALVGWIGAGDTSDRHYRVLKYSVMKDSLANPLLDLLSRYFDDEYFNDEGISFVRYCPLK